MLRASFLPVSLDLIPDKSIQQSKVGCPLFKSFVSEAQYLLFSSTNLLLSFLFSKSTNQKKNPERFSHSHSTNNLHWARLFQATRHFTHPIYTFLWQHPVSIFFSASEEKKSPADKSSPPLHLSSLKTFHGRSLLRAPGFSQPLQHKAHFSCVMGSSIKYEPGGAIIQLGAMAAMERRKNTSQRCESMKRGKIKKKNETVQRSDVKVLHPSALP